MLTRAVIEPRRDSQSSGRRKHARSCIVKKRWIKSRERSVDGLRRKTEILPRNQICRAAGELFEKRHFLEWNKPQNGNLHDGKRGTASSAFLRVYEHPMSTGRRVYMSAEKLSVRGTEINVRSLRLRNRRRRKRSAGSGLILGHGISGVEMEGSSCSYQWLGGNSGRRRRICQEKERRLWRNHGGVLG